MTQQTAQATGNQAGQTRLFSALHVLLILIAFFCIAFAVHHPGFSSPMVYDSHTWIEGKAHVFARGDLLEVMSIVPARPLFMATLYVSYLWHGMDPYWFRLFNVVILAAAGVALMLLTGGILQIPGTKPRGTEVEYRGVCVFLGLLFVMHPLQSFTVLYIWQREAILACMFYFGALAAYVAVRSGRFQRSYLGYVLTGTLFLLGMLSKEVLVTFPVVLVVAELTLFGQGLRQAVRRCTIIVATTLPPFALYLFISSGLHGPHSEHAEGIVSRLLGYYSLAGISPMDVVMTQCRVFFIYLSMILFPFHVGMLFITAMTVSTSLIDPPATLFAVGGIAALIASAVALLRKGALYAFGIFFVIIALLPESLLIPHYVFFGYRPILPMAGVLLILGAGLLQLLSWGKERLPATVFKCSVVAAFLVPTALLGFTSYNQAQRWNPLSFWQTAFHSLPEFSEKVQKIPYLDVLANLSGKLVAQGAYDRAVHVLKRPFSGRTDVTELQSKFRSDVGREMTNQELATALSETFRVDRRRTATALVNLGVALLESGNIPDAIFVQRKAVQTDPDSWLARFNLAVSLAKSGNTTEAMQHYRAAAAMNPRSARTYNNLGLALLASGRQAEALRAYMKALRLDPSLPEIHYNLGNLLLRLDRVQEAIESYRRTVALSPIHLEAHANMGAALLRSGKVAEAIESLNKALTPANRNPHLYNLLGVAYARQGKRAAALKHFKRALSLNPSHEEARRNLRTLEKKQP